MKIIRCTVLAIAIMLTISALTDIQRVHMSTVLGLSLTKHSPAGRVITFLMGMIFAVWYWGLKGNTRYGVLGLRTLFLGMFGAVLWKGVIGAVTEESLGGKIWSAVSQIVFAVIILMVGKRVLIKYVQLTTPSHDSKENLNVKK